MTEAGRVQSIAQALAQYREQSAGTQDSMRIPLGTGLTVEVVELPLDVPILNAASFRIAPLLADHPRADLVASDPESPEAQQIIGDLVRRAHRHADELKDSLIDGQDQPGLITRKGKLINGNTRCVLLRDLVAEGAVTFNTFRVGVLPASVNNAQELELESVLQQQREHKDEYNLVSELMMIKKLHDQANMSDAQIARRLRISSGAKKVAEYRAMLDLMERARRLATESLPLSAFIREGDARNQRQNWLELLGRVKDIDAGAGGRPAGDDHIRRWLVAFHLGHDSVHRLRHAVGPWVERDVLADLAEGEGVPAAVAVAVATPVNATEAPPGALPPGLDLLGDEPTPTPSADAAAVRQLLDIAVAAKRAGDGDVTLPDGTNLPAGDVRDSLQASVGRGLDAVKRRASAGSRLSRPANVLAQARNNLSDAQDALDDVIDDPLFDSQRDNVSAVVDELTELLNGLSLTLGRGEVQLADNDAG